MKNVILEKKDGVVEVLDNNEDVKKEMEDKYEKSYTPHLCWEYCEKASPKDCKKIADYIMKEIDAYDFISEGYQIIDENGEVEKFVVTECKDYVKSKKKNPTAEEKAAAKRARESLRIQYFDADSVDTAYATQYDQLQRGLLTNLRGLTKEELELMKRKYEKENNKKMK